MEEVTTMYELVQEYVLPLRDEVNKSLEDLRKSGTIGKSLQARAHITVVDDYDFVKLMCFGGSRALAEAFGVSDVFVTVTGSATVTVQKCDGTPCGRCWKHRDVEVHLYWPQDHLCGDCVRTLIEMLDKYPPYRVVGNDRVYISEHDALSRRYNDGGQE